ncbi:MAG: Fur family transcriptional regulator [Candidatus Omnitrophica bacterium]|nr:Fur family transcriptional regulator [Candidatus Omnitrophota bacterium]MDD5487880.1 Fur family transcriptional regulator [Candidatus Omnitrophota bacterium]
MQGRAGRAGRCGENWGHRFRGCGYRFTAPRKAIIDVLQCTPGHLSAEDIYMKVHEMCPQIGLTTVYRTLEVLTDMGLLSKFDFGDGRARYESVNGAGTKHHHHLVCTGCRRVIDYSEFVDDEIEFLERAEKGLSKKYRFEIKGHLIQFYGLCDKCKDKDGKRR